MAVAAGFMAVAGITDWSAGAFLRQKSVFIRVIRG
jgi:hypothetical protein